MAQPSPFFREDFQLKENHFALPEHSRELDPEKKRELTICNLFINLNMSISNIERVLDEDSGKIVRTLIENGILYDRRHITGRPPVGVERRIAQRTVRDFGETIPVRQDSPPAIYRSIAHRVSNTFPRHAEGDPKHAK